MLTIIDYLINNNLSCNNSSYLRKMVGVLNARTAF